MFLTKFAMLHTVLVSIKMFIIAVNIPTFETSVVLLPELMVNTCPLNPAPPYIIYTSMASIVEQSIHPGMVILLMSKSELWTNLAHDELSFESARLPPPLITKNTSIVLNVTSRAERAMTNGRSPNPVMKKLPIKLIVVFIVTVVKNVVYMGMALRPGKSPPIQLAVRKSVVVTYVASFIISFVETLALESITYLFMLSVTGNPVVASEIIPTTEESERNVGMCIVTKTIVVVTTTHTVPPSRSAQSVCRPPLSSTRVNLENPLLRCPVFDPPVTHQLFPIVPVTTKHV